MNKVKLLIGVSVFLSLAAIFTAHKAQADTFVGVLGPSYHLFTKADSKLNNSTFGISIGKDVTENVNVRAGVYYNSYRVPSWFVEGDYLPVKFGRIKLGAGIGAVTGYKKDFHHPVAPMAGVVASFTVNKNVSLETRWLPYTGNQGIQVLNISAVIRY